ncbi:MAG: hypothetical protein HLUCCA11_23730, partial [Phormidesmis priestleyi Ana]
NLRTLAPSIGSVLLQLPTGKRFTHFITSFVSQLGEALVLSSWGAEGGRDSSRRPAHLQHPL